MQFPMGYPMYLVHCSEINTLLYVLHFSAAMSFIQECGLHIHYIMYVLITFSETQYQSLYYVRTT